MNAPRPLILFSFLSVLVFTAGCRSTPTARSTHQETPGSFSDQAARSSYISARTKELTDKGVSPEEANGRASREWFARAPASLAMPTQQELKRREAQSSFEADLAKQKRESDMP